jgi:hypothetical protein
MLCLLALLSRAGAAAQTPSNTDISKDVENPVTEHITLPLHYEADFDDGPYQAAKSTFELDQAVVPFALGSDWSLITRTKLPFVADPPKKLHRPWEQGLANGYTTFFLSPRHGSGFYWGVGPVVYYPTATNSATGVNKWGAGPAIALLKKDAGPWEWGAVTNAIWTCGGPPHGKDRTRSYLLNPFVSYHFGDGWAVGSSPNIAADLLATPGQVWTLPAGASVSKAFHLGELPMRLAFDSYYNAIRPVAGNQTWLAEVTLTFVLPD